MKIEDARFTISFPLSNKSLLDKIEKCMDDHERVPTKWGEGEKGFRVASMTIDSASNSVYVTLFSTEFIGDDLCLSSYFGT